MNVTQKVSFTPGLEPVSILIITPPNTLPSFFVPDTTQTALQALAPEGQLWGDDEARAVAQPLVDADPRSSMVGGMTIVAATPPAPPEE